MFPLSKRLNFPFYLFHVWSLFPLKLFGRWKGVQQMQVRYEKYNLTKGEICRRCSWPNKALRNIAREKGKWILGNCLVFRQGPFPNKMIKSTKLMRLTVFFWDWFYKINKSCIITTIYIVKNLYSLQDYIGSKNWK